MRVVGGQPHLLAHHLHIAASGQVTVLLAHSAYSNIDSHESRGILVVHYRSGGAGGRRRNSLAEQESWFSLKFAVCVWDGAVSVLVLLQDITKSVVHELELKKLNEYKDEILASVTHDLVLGTFNLNNPLDQAFSTKTIARRSSP